MVEKHRWYLSGTGIIMILTLVAISTRLLPLSLSPYPFNNDGITESRIAADILASGSLQYPDVSLYENSHSIVTPVFNVLLAFYAAVIGTSTFGIAQFAVAAFSVITVAGSYVIGAELSRSAKGGLAAALFLSLFGTFVFLTGSAWKESLGVALFVLLVYAYVHRDDRRMLLLEVVVLGVIPFVHHLATVVVYFTLAYLTCWSLISAVMRKDVKRRHFVDLMILVAPSALAYIYYRVSSLESLSVVGSSLDLFLVALIFAALLAVMTVTLTKRNHAKISFAPIPALVVGGFFIFDYFNPIFPYAQGFSSYVVLIALLSCVFISLAWYGFEVITESKSKYRAIPLGLLLPVVTLVCYATVSGFELSSHKIFYRTLDFADISLSLGIGIMVAHLKVRPRLELIVTVCLVLVLLLSFPFGYMTNALVGVRHDTQDYELDAISWAEPRCASESSFSSDERIAYNARAMFDLGKDPYLPSKLANRTLPDSDFMNLLLEEWTTIGVNDYPRGHPVLDESYVAWVLDVSNVYYIGGPEANQAIIFQVTPVS